MVYEVPESKRSIDQNKWSFKVPGSETEYQITKAKYLPLGLVEKLEGKKDVTLKDIFDMFGGDEEVREAIRSLDTEQLQNLTEAWQNDSGVQLGE